MKLGLIIKITNNGESEYPLSFSKDGQWDKYAADARSLIKELDGFDETEKTVNLLRFLGKIGYLVGIIKARPEGSGRPFDNVAAWIYFPSHISVTGQETINAIDNVEKAISGRSGIDDLLLKQIFEKEYRSNDLLYSAADFIVSNANNPLGVMYYGVNTDYQINELLGSYIAQPEYSRYKGVFLINKSSNISLNGNADIKINPKAECIIKAPKPVDGFAPYIADDPFTKDISLVLGTPGTIVWKKEGATDIQKKFITSEHFSESEIGISRKDYQIIVCKEWFFVCDDNNIRIKDPSISINGKPLIDKTPIPYDSLEAGVTLTVSKEGFTPVQYDKYEMIHNNETTKKNIIKLKRNVHHYEFVFDKDCFSNGDSYKDARLIIESYHRLEGSPLKSFYSEERIREAGDNHLYKDNWKLKLKFFVYGIVACLLTIVIIAGWNAIDDYEFQFRWPPIKEYKQTDLQNENRLGGNAKPDSFIHYLDHNTVWEKDSIDTYTKHQGLFDELNRFDVAAIKNRSLGSTKLKEILKAFDYAKKHKLDFKKGKENGKYNRPGDYSITVEEYISWIETNHNESDETLNDSISISTSVNDVKPKNSNITGKHQKENTAGTNRKDGKAVEKKVSKNRGKE